MALSGCAKSQAKIGGFAHVYVVRIDQIVEGTDIAVLKRVAVPDKEALANMRTEVDTMVDTTLKFSDLLDPFDLEFRTVVANKGFVYRWTRKGLKGIGIS